MAEILHQLRLLVYPMIYTSKRWSFGISEPSTVVTSNFLKHQPCKLATPNHSSTFSGPSCHVSSCNHVLTAATTVWVARSFMWGKTIVPYPTHRWSWKFYHWHPQPQMAERSSTSWGEFHEAWYWFKGSTTWRFFMTGTYSKKNVVVGNGIKICYPCGIQTRWYLWKRRPFGFFVSDILWHSRLEPKYTGCIVGVFHSTPRLV